jgi:hypothetical protein
VIFTAVFFIACRESRHEETANADMALAKEILAIRSFASDDPSRQSLSLIEVVPLLTNESRRTLYKGTMKSYNSGLLVPPGRDIMEFEGSEHLIKLHADQSLSVVRKEKK